MDYVSIGSSSESVEVSASPGSPSPTPAHVPLRLRLKRSSISAGPMDGGWWPRSRDLIAEARVSVEHFPRWFDRIWRVVYATPGAKAAMSAACSPSNAQSGTGILNGCRDQSRSL